MPTSSPKPTTRTATTTPPASPSPRPAVPRVLYSLAEVAEMCGGKDAGFTERGLAEQCRSGDITDVTYRGGKWSMTLPQVESLVKGHKGVGNTLGGGRMRKRIEDPTDEEQRVAAARARAARRLGGKAA